tara:strand:+ start:116 stop:463 length:348 start_codon:yes stop_codon:yes gene_type:complete
MTTYLFNLSGGRGERVDLQITKDIAKCGLNAELQQVDFTELERMGFDNLCMIKDCIVPEVGFCNSEKLGVILWKKYPWSKSKLTCDQPIIYSCKNGWLKSAFMFAWALLDKKSKL